MTERLSDEEMGILADLSTHLAPLFPSERAAIQKLLAYVAALEAERAEERLKWDVSGSCTCDGSGSSATVPCPVHGPFYKQPSTTGGAR